MASFVPSRPETYAERARYTSAGLTEVACMDCLVSVLVRKNSDHQTAIQWTVDGEGRCPELTRRDLGPRHSIQAGCPRLAASIDAAVRSGHLPVGASSD